jgi:PKD repeat protein
MELKPGTNNVLYVTSKTSFYKSTDGGNTFSVITAGLPVPSSSSRLAIAVTAANPEIVYVVSSNSSDNGFKGLYRSSNSGNGFSLMSDAPNLLGWDSWGGDTGGQGWFTLSIAASPNNENIVSIGGVNIWTSFDGGETWEIRAHWYGDNGTPYVHADIHDLTYNPHNNLLYAASDGGIFEADAGINSWTDLSNGLQIGQMYRLGCSASNASLVVQGWQDNGTNQYNAGQWNRILGGDGMECFIDWSNPNYQYGESQYGNIARSDDGGSNFQGITNNINEDGEWVTPWTQHPTAAATIFAGFKNVWKSSNRGDSWTKISNLNIGGITILEVSKSNPSTIYISNGTAIFKTDNGGTTWNNLIIPSAGSNAITDLAINDSNPNKIWMTRSGYTAGNKVYQSDDGGANWQNISSGLPNIPCNTIVNQAGTNNGVYVGTDFGVYYYDSQIQTWIPYMNGMPNVRIDELEIHYASNKLRAATYGRGLWESSIYNPNSLKPFANFTSNVVSGCPGFTVQFTDQSFGNPTSWQWSFPGGTPAFSTDQNPVVTYNNAATYNHVTLRAQNASGIDSVIKLNYIAVSPFIKPTITLNNNDTLCEGQSVQLKCSNAQAYLWYPNSYGNISFSTDTSGVYAVRTTDVFGCQTFSDTISIMVIPVQPVSISMSNDSLFASISTGLQWYVNGNPIAGATDSVYIAAQVGTYSVISTQANGCTSASNNLATALTGAEKTTQSVEIFPNPGNGNFAFSYPAKDAFTVDVFDMEGKLLMTRFYAQKDQINKVYSLNCEHLSAGNYLMKIRDNENAISRKLSIVKH